MSSVLFDLMLVLWHWTKRTNFGWYWWGGSSLNNAIRKNNCNTKYNSSTMSRRNRVQSRNLQMQRPEDLLDHPIHTWPGHLRSLRCTCNILAGIHWDATTSGWCFGLLNGSHSWLLEFWAADWLCTDWGSTDCSKFDWFKFSHDCSFSISLSHDHSVC